MAARNLLHKSKLEDFKQWCMHKGYATASPKGHFQVFQVYINPHGWVSIYEKINSKEHYSVDKRMVGMVKQFIKDKKESK